MPLRFDLGPFEKLHIGKTILLNSHERAYFVFEGDVPIMRGKDVLQPELARNSLEELYCCIQKLYLEEAFAEHQDALSALMAKALSDEPSLLSDLKQVEALVMNREHFKALKRLKSLMDPAAFVVERSEPANYVRRNVSNPRKSLRE